MRAFAMGFLLTLLCTSVLAADTPADMPDLVGEWNHTGDFLKTGTVLLPDGRYVTEMEIGTQKLTEIGTYSYRDGVLTATPRDGGPPKKYKIKVNGESLVLTDEAGVNYPYTRRPGSAKEVVEEARKIDEKKAVEDKTWAAKFPTAKAKPGKNLPIGDVPEDPSPDRVFEGATVFESQQTYSVFWNMNIRHIVVQGPDPGNGLSQTRYYFFPNGRFLYMNIRYTGTAGPDNVARRATVEVLKLWGKYKIDSLAAKPGEKPAAETLTVVTDKGEEIALQLIDGRRNLVHGGKAEQGGNTVYSNVVWNLEALKKAAE